MTIRLLDPPLHEFLPNQPELRAHVERARLEHHDDLEELEALLTRVEFDKAGLDYVSCSPPRVPIARVAAARAVLGKPS